jgi:hypothetical protein
MSRLGRGSALAAALAATAGGTYDAPAAAPVPQGLGVTYEPRHRANPSGGNKKKRNERRAIEAKRRQKQARKRQRGR